MVNMYESIRDSSGDNIDGLTKFFIKTVNEDDSISEFLSGTSIVPNDPGTLLIVDEWIVEQVDKLLFIDGELVVKEGETLDEPVKSDIELQEEELLRQLAELRAQKSEPAQ